jgi:hypothetical protein
MPAKLFMGKKPGEISIYCNEKAARQRRLFLTYGGYFELFPERAILFFLLLLRKL